MKLEQIDKLQLCIYMTEEISSSGGSERQTCGRSWGALSFSMPDLASATATATVVDVISRSRRNDIIDLERERRKYPLSASQTTTNVRPRRR